MYVSHIELNNFRNYRSGEITPCAGINVLYGDNAQGKTALLEAVVLSCIGRSHRTPRDRELIRMGEDFGRVSVTAERRDGSHSVEIVLSADKHRSIKVNGSPLKRIGELMGHINGVLFAPEDLRMVKDGPELRRRFIDMELSQLYPAYFYALQRYSQALKQRNKLLHDILITPSLISTLDGWDMQLSQSGEELIRFRSAFIKKLAVFAAKNHEEISGGRETLTVAYEPSYSGESLAEALYAARDNDLRRCTTTVGPHRDDLMLMLGDMDVRTYGSQGQQRTTALSLKLSELDIMKDETGEYPLLMLDDVMSELDPHRRRQLLGRLKGIQTIVNCTDMSDLAEAEVEAAWKVTAGTLSQLAVDSEQ